MVFNFVIIRIEISFVGLINPFAVYIKTKKNLQSFIVELPRSIYVPKSLIILLANLIVFTTTISTFSTATFWITPPIMQSSQITASTLSQITCFYPLSQISQPLLEVTAASWKWVRTQRGISTLRQYGYKGSYPCHTITCQPSSPTKSPPASTLKPSIIKL